MDSQTNAFLGEVAAAVIAGPLVITTAPVVHLAKAPFAPGPTLTPAGVTEADFSGYAAKPITGFGTVHTGPSGNQVVEATPLLTWTPTGSSVANTIYGWYVVDHVGNIVSSGLLPAPVVLNGVTTTLSMVWGLGFNLGSYTSTVLP